MSRQTTKRHVKMTDLFDIKGKIAVMTGSTGVLGKGIASYLASQGCAMLLLCREQSKDKAEAIVEAIREEGGKAAFHVADALAEAGIHNALNAHRHSRNYAENYSPKHENTSRKFAAALANPQFV